MAYRDYSHLQALPVAHQTMAMLGSSTLIARGLRFRGLGFLRFRGLGF